METQVDPTRCESLEMPGDKDMILDPVSKSLKIVPLVTGSQRLAIVDGAEGASQKRVIQETARVDLAVSLFEFPDVALVVGSQRISGRLVTQAKRGVPDWCDGRMQGAHPLVWA